MSDVVSKFTNAFGEEFKLLRLEDGGYGFSGIETDHEIVPVLFPVVSGFIMGWEEMAWLATAMANKGKL